MTTPEEAQAFLAAMRDKSHQREILHVPPTHLSADGMDAWYLQQRKREKELRERRKEAEALLRGYRGTGETGTTGRMSLGTPLGTPRSALSESLHDPLRMSLHLDNSKEGEEKAEEGGTSGWSSPSAEEKKSDEKDLSWLNSSIDNKGKERRAGPQPPALPPPATESRSSSNASPPILNSNPSNASSEFEISKPETIWRDFISPVPGAKFPPEAGRYHLYVSYACPGSHRALIVRTLKGLENTVTVTYVHPTWRLTNPEDRDDKHRGWIFGDPFGKSFPNTIGRGGPFPPSYRNTDPDPEFNSYSIREIYERAEDTSGKYTIPLLWDSKLKTIVNNESSDIAYMLNSCFNDFAEYPDLDLYTEDDEDGRAKLTEVNEWLAPLMIHGVYRCGFAKNQHAYDRAIAELCEAYDRADDILQKQRYLTGDTLTDADIRLFVTLVRFDEVYSIYFKANARMVMLTPSLLNFCRDIYQTPGIADTCDMDQIKAHFFGSHAEWNKYSVIPRGLGFMELLEMPHDRHEFGAEV